MNIDWSFNLGNIFTLVFWFVTVIWIIVQHRDRVLATETRALLIENNTESSILAAKAELSARCNLIEQAQKFAALAIAEDRIRYDRHWVEVKEMLDRILEKLDRKADK